MRLSIAAGVDGRSDEEVRHGARHELSPKFQIVIPEEIRERLDLKPGQQVALIDRDGFLAVVPQRPHLRAARSRQGAH